MPTLFGAPEFTPVFSGVRVIRSLVVCFIFCRSLFVLLSFFFWPMCFLSFYLRILITLLGIFKLFLFCTNGTIFYLIVYFTLRDDKDILSIARSG